MVIRDLQKRRTLKKNIKYSKLIFKLRSLSHILILYYLLVVTEIAQCRALFAMLRGSVGSSETAFWCEFCFL